MQENINKLCQQNSITPKPSETPPTEKNLVNITQSTRELSANVENVVESKKCNRCKKILSVNLFYPIKYYKTGISAFRSICKKCSSEERKSPKSMESARRSAKKYNKKNKPKVSLFYKKYNSRPDIKAKLKLKNKQIFLKSPTSIILRGAKQRAKRKGMEFCISEKDIIIPFFCPIFWIPLRHNDEHATDNSPSLDRIDNTRGYLPDNVIIVSNKANWIKSCFSIEDIETVANFYINPNNFLKEREFFKNDLPLLLRKQKILKTIKDRATRTKREFSLSLDDIKIPKICPIFGFPLSLTNDKKLFNSPSIDRIDNNKGYTKDNIIIISWKANHLKGCASPEELLKITEFYKIFKKDEKCSLANG